MSDSIVVRCVKSSQGSRRGTYGWITSFFILTRCLHLYIHGPVAQPGACCLYCMRTIEHRPCIPYRKGGGLGFKSCCRAATELPDGSIPKDCGAQRDSVPRWPIQFTVQFIFIHCCVRELSFRMLAETVSGS